MLPSQFVVGEIHPLSNVQSYKTSFDEFRKKKLTPLKRKTRKKKDYK